MKQILKNPRIIVWVALIVISIILIGPNINPRGVTITYLGKNSSLPLASGEVLYEINDQPVTQAVLEKGYDGVVKFDTNKGTRYANVNGTLDLKYSEVSSTNLKFGLDLKGGVHAVLQPNKTDNYTIDQIISTLQTRINVYGLREANFRPVYYEGKGFVEISIAGGTPEELRNLIESQGKFEAKIPLNIPVSNGAAKIVLDKTYTLTVVNSSIVVNGVMVNESDTFRLSGTDFLFGGINGNSLNITSTVFTGNDVVTVFFDPQRSRLEQQPTGYRWTFGVQLSSTGAQRFAWVTQNTNILPSGYLDQQILLYLDSRPVDSLSIASSLKGRAETEISIGGPAATKDAAIQARAQLQSILRSGALPTEVTIVQVDDISPTLGLSFLNNAMLSGAAAIIGVIIIVSIRYRKPKLVLPMVLISLSEVIIVLGAATLIGWTIDLAAIAGLIASVGTGVDSQIIILDRALRKEETHLETLHEKLRKAFFVVFGSAGTVVAAMLPLLVLGIGLLRGFAIVTIIGVFVGVFVARPAYGVILEHMKKD